jgi:hypothetical protein
VVTLLELVPEELPEVPLELVPDVPLEPVPAPELVVLLGLLVVVVVGLLVVVVLDVVNEPLPDDVVGLVLVLAVEVRAASAGSWPDTSTTAISSHAARNSATDPLTTRRRILRIRAARASLIACPRRRVESAFCSVMVNLNLNRCRIQRRQRCRRPSESSEGPVRRA